MTTFDTSISPEIFNFAKTDYAESSIFFGQKSGLLDTMNKPFPQLERLYKKLKSMDWDEMEFDFEPCNIEFKKMDSSLSQPMITQLGWQWETDSIAARAVSPIMSGFTTSDMVHQMYQLIGGNEVVHARAYAEIVKFSFDHPEDVMQSVIQVSQSAQRLETISKIFSQAYKTSHMLALGQVPRNQETFNVFYLFVVAMFILERLQFMTSFAITFAYGTNGHFMPICKSVQKICQDEYEIHAVAGAHMIDLLSDTGEGVMANYQLGDTIKKMVDEVMAVETKWLPFLMGNRKDIFGVTERDLLGWNHFCAKDVYTHLRIKSDITFPKANPLDYMDTWVNISSIQASLQEEKNGQYLLGMIRRDDVGKAFSIAGL